MLNVDEPCRIGVLVDSVAVLLEIRDLDDRHPPVNPLAGLP
jgi:hypothetical protein